MEVDKTNIKKESGDFAVLKQQVDIIEIKGFKADSVQVRDYNQHAFSYLSNILGIFNKCLSCRCF